MISFRALRLLKPPYSYTLNIGRCQRSDLTGPIHRSPLNRPCKVSDLKLGCEACNYRGLRGAQTAYLVDHGALYPVFLDICTGYPLDNGLDVDVA